MSVLNVIPLGRMEADIDRILGTYSAAVSTALATGLGAIAIAGLTLYLMFMGLAIARGEVQDPLGRLSKEFLSTVIIASIAVAAGTYQSVVVGASSALQEFIISKLTNGQAASVGDSLALLFTQGKVVVKIDEGQTEVPMFTALWILAKANESQIGIPDLSYAFGALCVWVATAFVAIFCLIPLLLAKVGIAIMLAIWPQTRNYFASWLSNLLGNILTLALISAIATLLSQVFQKIIQDSLQGAGAGEFNAVPMGLAILVVGATLAFVALNIAAQGAQLAGGGLAMDTKGIVGSAIQTYLLYRNSKGSGKNPEQGGGVGRGKSSPLPSGGASSPDAGGATGAAQGGAVSPAGNPSPSASQRVAQVLSGIANRSKK